MPAGASREIGEERNEESELQRAGGVVTVQCWPVAVLLLVRRGGRAFVEMELNVPRTSLCMVHVYRMHGRLTAFEGPL